jgi:hypothetical protein
MSDEEDIDLLALQRQLDDAFETTRPRRGFEDELWLRLQSRRPFWRRLQDGLGGLLDGIREVPPVPAGAVAVVLILVIGIGVVLLSGPHFGGGASSTATSAVAQPGGAQYAMAPGSFGSLPSVALHPFVPFQSTKGSPVPADLGEALAPTNLYFGPATLSWTGQFPAFEPALVYRYHEPSASQADQFATSLGAAPANPAPNSSGLLGSYNGQGFTLSVTASSSIPAREPRFFLNPIGASASGSDPEGAATAFLATHSLVPTQPYTVNVASSGNQVRVQFLREFQLSNSAAAYVIGPSGDRYGTEVLLQDGRTVLADGALPVSLDRASYPLISANQAIHRAVGSSPSGTQAISPQPVVKLDKVELVYALAFSSAQGFYEPAYLFSGSFQYQGQTMVKRVLVPAIDPSQLNS